MVRKKKYTLSKPPAVVVGVCGHGLAVLRALAGHGIPLIALDANRWLPGVHTRLASVEMVADINGPSLVDALLDLRSRIDCPGDPVLFLTNDVMVISIGKTLDKLAGKYRLSWSHCADKLLSLIDKASLERTAKSQQLNYPQSILLQAESEVHAAADHVGFPMIVKPTRPLCSFKTYQPQTVDELQRWTAIHRSELPFVVQRFIAGDDRTIHFSALYLDRGRVLARFDGRKLRSRPLGHTTVAESLPHDEVHAQTLRFFSGMELSGPVSLELKRAGDGSFWVIEPTVGRTDFWLGLCTANRVNLPLTEYLHQVGEAVACASQTDEVVWFNEERDPLGRVWFALRPDLHLKGRRATYLYLNRDDLHPMREAVRVATQRLAGRLGGVLRLGRSGSDGLSPSV